MLVMNPAGGRPFLSLALICLYSLVEFNQSFSFQPFCTFLQPVTGEVQMSPRKPWWYLEQGTCSYFVCALADDEWNMTLRVFYPLSPKNVLML